MLAEIYVYKFIGVSSNVKTTMVVFSPNVISDSRDTNFC